MTPSTQSSAQIEQLSTAIEHALGELRTGPPIGAFGIAREDCALAHIDFFHSIEIATVVLAGALAEVRGTTMAAIFEEFGTKSAPCDCESCVGPEKAREAREKHRAAYTNVVPRDEVEAAVEPLVEAYDHLIHERRDYAIVCVEQSLTLLGVDPAGRPNDG